MGNTHMTYRRDIPRGMVLSCRYCDWRPDDAVTIGVVLAHFATEPDHGDGSINFELIVVCPRCSKAMVFEREIRPGREQYTCPAPCHRTRVITRRT
jgi:hypothetical protein